MDKLTDCEKAHIVGSLMKDWEVMDDAERLLTKSVLRKIDPRPFSQILEEWWID